MKTQEIFYYVWVSDIRIFVQVATTAEFMLIKKAYHSKGLDYKIKTTADNDHEFHFIHPVSDKK